jgi:lysophospholipase L1-like esterase
MMKLRNILPVMAAVLLFACEPEIERYTPQSGDADFSVFVSLGNSLTAGFADFELYQSGQEHAFPALMARQLTHLGLEDFNLPLMYDELGFGNRLVLGYATDCLGVTGMGPVPKGGTPDPGNQAWLGDATPFHNLGVPGAKTSHLLAAGYGQMNPYFGRFARNPQTSSVLGDAMALNPTFFSLWIGANDILSYATSGGEGEGITPVADFENFLGILLNQLTSNGAQGVIANLPDITSIPFFTTVPYNGLVLVNQEQVDALNAAYAQAPHINFELGPNGFVVSDPGAPGGLRQLQEGELMLLTVPQDNIKCQGWGSQVPIPAQYYLSINQINNIRTATGQYNEVIAGYAGAFGLALVDIHSLLASAQTGIWFDGLNFNTQFVAGGVFSLDGVHLSKRGNAVVANHFIEAINDTYNASIPKLTISEFEGIIFP